MRFHAALTMRRTETIRTGIPAADDDDPFPLRGQRLVRDGNAGRALVLLGEIFHGEMHALQFAARDGQLSRLFRSHRQSNGVELLAQLLAGDVFADGDAGLELHPFGFHLFETTVDDPLFHFEVRNPVAEQAADAIGLLEQRHAMAGARQLLRCRQPRRTGADDRHRLARFDYRQDRGHEAFVEAAVDDVPFDDADGDGLFVDAAHAGAFAGSRTETAGKFRKVVRAVQRLQRVIPAATINEVVPLGNQVDDGAAGVPLAEGHAAVHTTGALDLEFVLGDGLVHLLPIEHAQLDRLPLRALAGVFHETLRVSHGYLASVSF